MVVSTSGVGDRYDARVGVTFAHLWQRFPESQRQLEETTVDLYEGYGRTHLLPFFGEIDLGLIQRAEPLRAGDAVPGYETALDRLGEAARHVDVMVPGQRGRCRGSRSGGPAGRRSWVLDALRRGVEPVDARLEQDWLSGPHQSNLERARHSSR